MLMTVSRIQETCQPMGFIDIGEELTKRWNFWRTEERKYQVVKGRDISIQSLIIEDRAREEKPMTICH